MSKILSVKDQNQIIEQLKSGQIGVLPTDTIYGLHCCTFDPELVQKIYVLKQRPEKMPLITLISSVSDLSLFNINLDNFAKDQINKFWPGCNTLIIDEISFRLPENDFLINIIKQTGPLISTSANIHGQLHAKNIAESVEYFGDTVDFYVDGGDLNNKPSSVYKISNGTIIKIR